MLSSWPTNTGVSGPLGDGRCAKGGAGGDRDGRAPPRVERTASASVVASIARCVTRGVRSTDVSAGRHCSAGLPWRVWQRVRCRVYVGQWSQVSRHRVCCGNDDDTSTGSLEAVEMAPQEGLMYSYPVNPWETAALGCARCGSRPLGDKGKGDAEGCRRGSDGSRVQYCKYEPRRRAERSDINGWRF